MRFKTILLILIIIVTTGLTSRRSRGRSRGSSGGSSTFWNRKNKGASDAKPVANQPKPVSQPKPSAPEPEIKKETAKVQQSAPANSARPVGWNVDNGPAKATNVNPSYSAPSPHNPYGGGGYPQQHSSGHGYPQANGYQPNGGLYSGQPGGYQHGGGLNAGPPGGYQPGGGVYPGQHGGGFHPGQPGGYQQQGGGFNPGYGGYPNGHNPYQGQNYGNGYNPHFPNQNMGHMGGYGGYPQQTGMMGSSLFGGKKHGFGGYGGFGGVAPYGYGYGMKKSGGFFGKHAFRNILGGLAVWWIVSGLIRTPYRVYTFSNPPKERQEITLPPNVLTLCNENATSICTPGTLSICTTDNKILCVVGMTSAAPCQNNSAELCVNSTIPCVGTDDPLCQNKTTADNTTSVSLPCFTNMTMDASSGTLPPNITLPKSENKFCVTTMAVPDPTIPDDGGKNSTAQSGWDPSAFPRYGGGLDEGKPVEVPTEQSGWDPAKFGQYGTQFGRPEPYGISG